MVVDDLKQECRLRQLPTSGTKAILITRLREAVAQDESISTERLSTNSQRKKRVSNKKEPQRSDFASDEEYKEAWHKWREIRDHNNDSVKRSRQAAKQRKQQHEKLCKQRQAENKQLSNEVASLRNEIELLRQVLASPDEVEQDTKQRLQTLFDKLGPAPVASETDSQAHSVDSTGAAFAAPLTADVDTDAADALPAKRSK